MSQGAPTPRRAPTASLTAELDRLLRETYALWEPGWVNFNWRGYTYDHVRRVTSLSLRLCRDEGGDRRVVELAALLHDITKPYDGRYVLDEGGQRVVDERGYWRNETRWPLGRNEVTDLYDRLGLGGQPHNISGGGVAHEILTRRGVDEDLALRATKAIRDHLRPPDDALAESLCLYDADTIDANIGLPALVRNIYIRLHYRDLRREPDEMPTERLIREAPMDYLTSYVRESLPTWASGKRRDFVPRLTTETARALAQERLNYLDGVLRQMQTELDHPGEACAHGALAVMLHYMTRRAEPSVNSETDYLRKVWLEDGEPSPAARQLVFDLDAQVHGRA